MAIAFLVAFLLLAVGCSTVAIWLWRIIDRHLPA